MNKSELVKKLYETYDKGEQWLQEIPNEINEAFFDNPAIESQAEMIQILMGYILTEDERAAVGWFFHEWYYNRKLSIHLNDEEFKFLCIDDYLSYLQSHEGWE